MQTRITANPNNAETRRKTSSIKARHCKMKLTEEREALYFVPYIFSLLFPKCISF
jgi:hypothetical protein